MKTSETFKSITNYSLEVALSTVAITGIGIAFSSWGLPVSISKHDVLFAAVTIAFKELSQIVFNENWQKKPLVKILTYSLSISAGLLTYTFFAFNRNAVILLSLIFVVTDVTKRYFFSNYIPIELPQNTTTSSEELGETTATKTTPTEEPIVEEQPDPKLTPQFFALLKNYLSIIDKEENWLLNFCYFAKDFNRLASSKNGWIIFTRKEIKGEYQPLFKKLITSRILLMQSFERQEHNPQAKLDFINDFKAYASFVNSNQDNIGLFPPKV